MKDFKEIYKAPFTQTMGTHVISSNGTMSFTFDIDMAINNEPFCAYVISILNGQLKDGKRNNYVFWIKGVNLFVKDDKTEYMIGSIRGWGYLTGLGALNLNETDAIAIQNDFGKWMIDTLNG